MSTVIVTGADGAAKPIEGRAGESLMETIREAGFDELLAICGGACACATCHVYVDDPSALDLLPPMSPDEDALLEAADDRRPTSRLSCQIPLSAALEGLRVTIAPN